MALDSRASVIRCSFESLTFRMVRIVGRNTNLFFSSIFIFVRIFRTFVTFFFFFWQESLFSLTINEKYRKKRINLWRVPSSEQILQSSGMKIRFIDETCKFVTCYRICIQREKIFKSLTKQWIALQIMDSGFHSFLVPTIFIDLRYFYLPSLYN